MRKITKQYEFKLQDNKGCCILGIAGSGKSEKCKILQKELGEGKYAVCAPTHKAALLIGAVTIYHLFNIDTHTHTYLKSAVENLKVLVLNGFLSLKSVWLILKFGVY